MAEINHNRKRAITLAILGCLGLAALFIFKSKKTEIRSMSGITWATEYNITYDSDKQLDDSILTVFRKVDLSVSPFNKASRITAINENQTSLMDDYLVILFDASREIWEASDGAFDPTLSPLINAWGFGYKSGNLPTETQIDSLRQLVGFDKLKRIKHQLIKQDKRMSLNYSSIAKGFGCDEVGRMLERNGVENYLVEIGGEIVARGTNPRGEKWRISVDKPIESADSIIHESAQIIELNNAAIATSGNYRNFKTDENGRHISHIIDPKTGYSTSTDILSVTVVAKDCMTADGWATALTVLGSEKAKATLQKHPELAAMLITRGTDGAFHIWTTDNYKKLIVSE